MSVPKFAVLGHPNKGKSSIVSTLAQDDSVEIGETPGTTEFCREFPMSVDGKTLYTLIDTPGFQRPRQALEWMKENETSVDRHPEVVRQFINNSKNKKHFPDESKLLAPLTEGAGILYVVDGSVPYGAEYEAEMEILRWTAQPSLAIVNPIGGEEFVEEWTNALRQYFNVVHVFNPLTADFEKSLELLTSFATLKADWREPLRSAIQILRENRLRYITRASFIISQCLFEILSHTSERRVQTDDTESKIKASLESEYKLQLQEKEQYARRKIQELYLQRRLESSSTTLVQLDDLDLFSEKTWRIFGLKKRELATLGLLSGAALGGALDISTGGASLFMGAIIGGALGAGAAVMGGASLVDAKLLSLPLGKKIMVVGPAQNANLGFIVLARARLHHAVVSDRSHANRGDLGLDDAMQHLVPPLELSEQSKLAVLFSSFAKEDSGEEELNSLQKIIEQLLKEDVMSKPLASTSS